MIGDDPNMFNGAAPVFGEPRYVLLRTAVSVTDGGTFDPKFATFDLHPLPIGATEDSAMDTAMALADDEESWIVYLGKWTAVEAIDGLAKLTQEAKDSVR